MLNLRNIIFEILENFIYIKNDSFEYLEFINFNVERGKKMLNSKEGHKWYQQFRIMINQQLVERGHDGISKIRLFKNFSRPLFTSVFMFLQADVSSFLFLKSLLRLRISEEHDTITFSFSVYVRNTIKSAYRRNFSASRDEINNPLIISLLKINICQEGWQFVK